ncbi:hypothetical protein V5799_018194 [Amblyomma americanum]|uniref:Uncharacterized protein n=1 Tax=Amblyomma americanum TaxID=6943 RepID=A0AAQ4F155_AMBAM
MQSDREHQAGCLSASKSQPDRTVSFGHRNATTLALPRARVPSVSRIFLTSNSSPVPSLSPEEIKQKAIKKAATVWKTPSGALANIEARATLATVTGTQHTCG